MGDIEKKDAAWAEGDHAEKEYGMPDFVPPTPKEEAAVIRKLDFRLIPLVFLLYMLAVLDRSNLGNARLAGLEVCYVPSQPIRQGSSTISTITAQR